jgi:hypothetical protein
MSSDMFTNIRIECYCPIIMQFKSYISDLCNYWAVNWIVGLLLISIILA